MFTLILALVWSPTPPLGNVWLVCVLIIVAVAQEVEVVPFPAPPVHMSMHPWSRLNPKLLPMEWCMNVCEWVNMACSVKVF